MSESSSFSGTSRSAPSESIEGLEPESGLTSAEHFACALHEVSNALTVVLGWLDMAGSSESLEEARVAISVAAEHARRGRVISRRAIGAEATSEHPRRTAGALAEFAATSVRPEAEARGVTVVAISASGTSVYLDSEDRTLQVLTNLLLNGIAFSPAGASVALSVVRHGASLIFSVQDEGPGIPVARRGMLFTAPVSTRAGGAGIGLPHSKQLALECGGDLTLASTEQGARFDLSWPIPSLPSFRPSVLPSRASELRGARVLVIEDDPAVGALIDLSFGARGAEVITVSDCTQLAGVLLGRPVLDLVLLDLSPVEGQLVATLDALERVAPKARVVLMSGQPTGVPSEADGRFAAWVRKPFDLEELVLTVRNLLRTRIG